MSLVVYSTEQRFNQISSVLLMISDFVKSNQADLILFINNYLTNIFNYDAIKILS